jgi:predicted nucleotidyltransferase
MILDLTIKISPRPDATYCSARRLGQTPQSEGISLFGAYARGDAGPDSELDFRAAFPNSPLSRYLRSVEASKLMAYSIILECIVVLTRQGWDSEQRVICSLASTVRRERVKLHG